MYICIYIYIHLLWKGSPLLSCFGFFWKLSTSFGVSIKLGSFPSTFFGVFIKLGSFPSTPPLYPSHILKGRPKNRHTYFQNTKLRTYVWYILAIFLLYTKSIHSHHGLRRTQLGNSGFFWYPPVASMVLPWEIFSRLPSISPTEPQKHEVSLVCSSKNTSCMASDSDAFQIPQKCLVRKARHYFSWIQFCFQSLRWHVVNTMMFWPQFEKFFTFLLTLVRQMRHDIKWRWKQSSNSFRGGSTNGRCILFCTVFFRGGETK